MPRVGFFAVCEDHRQVFEYLLTETDFRFYELYSEYGQEIREFKSFNELHGTFDVGRDPHGHGYAVNLSIWSPSSMPQFHIRKIRLDPKKCEGHTFRYAAGGAIVVQLCLGGIHKNIVTKSEFAHLSERGALLRGIRSGVDWPVLSKFSSRIRRHISDRLAVAHAPGRHVLPAANALFMRGHELKESAKWPGTYSPIPVAAKYPPPVV